MACCRIRGGGKHRLLAWPFLAVALITASGRFVSGQLKQPENDSKQEQNSQGEQVVITVPQCVENEFLSSNGTHIICKKLPPVGFCDCPNFVPMVGSGQPPVPAIPPPPAGCEVFSPPTRGAHTCLRLPDTIYCSVLCDHRFEFSLTPKNPYYCGQATGFLWRAYPSDVIVSSLPKCTGFRHRLRLIHPYDYYLPAPCYGLSNQTIAILLEELANLLKDRGCDNCQVENTFLQCAEVNASARFYGNVSSALNEK